MTRNNCWLPELNEFPQTSFTVASYKEYEASLYCTYKKDFWSNDLFFQGLKVQVRKSPIIDGYEESFVHFTCKNYENVQNREPDFRRCERLHWIRKFIENYQCKARCVEKCDGIKYWEEPYKSTMRFHFLFEEERFLVVLEKREYYCLLITAFYLEYDHSLQKQLKHYRMYKKAEDVPFGGTSPETPSTTSR